MNKLKPKAVGDAATSRMTLINRLLEERNTATAFHMTGGQPPTRLPSAPSPEPHVGSSHTDEQGAHRAAQNQCPWSANQTATPSNDSQATDLLL